MRSLLSRLAGLVPALAMVLLAFPGHAEVTPVEVVYPQLEQSRQVLQLTGTVEAAQHAGLATQQSGLIASLHVEVGDRVAKGAKLLTLDDTLARLGQAEAAASVEVARVALAEAKRLYEEVLALSKQKVIAETLIGERRAGLAQARAELARQQANLASQQEVVRRHTLYAPFAGVIATRNADIGEWVSQQTAVLTLVQQHQLRLNVAIPQEYYGQLVDQANIAVTVTPDFANAQAIKASLSRLVAVSNSQSRTLTAHIDLPDNARLLAGMSAKAELELPLSREDLVWLPKSAIKLHPDGGASIFAVVNNKAKRFLITVIRQRDNLVAVAGAPADFALVASGVELMRDGNAVKINNPQGKPL